MVSIPSTVSKALSLLNLVAEQPGSTLTELAGESGIPPATAHRLLGALIQFGLVRVTSDRRHHLGARCLALGSRFLAELDLKGEARPTLESLVEATGETVHLGVMDGTSVVYVDKVETSHPVRMYSRVGAVSPLHSTGIGKALLAYGDPSIVDRVLAAGLERRTPNTITDPDALLVELRRIREHQFAIDDVENEEGIRCVAAPVFAIDGRAVAAISISGPESRVTRERVLTMAETLMESTNALSERLGYGEVDEASRKQEGARRG